MPTAPQTKAESPRAEEAPPKPGSPRRSNSSLLQGRRSSGTGFNTDLGGGPAPSSSSAGSTAGEKTANNSLLRGRKPGAGGGKHQLPGPSERGSLGAGGTEKVPDKAHVRQSSASVNLPAGSGAGFFGRLIRNPTPKLGKKSLDDTALMEEKRRSDRSVASPTSAPQGAVDEQDGAAALGGAASGDRGVGFTKPSPTQVAVKNSRATGPRATASGGFFSKLFNRKPIQSAPNGSPAAVATTAPIRRKVTRKMAASELEDLEAQLEAAGFAQLPGTLLSRAKGELLDRKFLLRWQQFELQRDIGEGAYASVYLATATMPDGSVREVALKELKLLGNETDPDIKLEVEATADAISDCGFPTVAKALRVAGQLLTHAETYETAQRIIAESLQEFQSAADMEDDACVIIVQILEAMSLVARPAKPHNKDRGTGAAGAPQRLLKDVMSEAEVLSKLYHKNIVEFIGCCLELPHLAIAMQFAHKGPLSELLLNDTVSLGWDLRMKWAKETAEAVEYLHSLDPKIIHRDLVRKGLDGGGGGGGGANFLINIFSYPIHRKQTTSLLTKTIPLLLRTLD